MSIPAPLPEPLEDRVRLFLDRYRAASAGLNADAQRECFADTFLAGDASGARPVPREAFLAALPARAAAAEKAGVGRAELEGASMLRLDEAWVLLRTEWSSPQQGGGRLPMTATYLLHDDGTRLRITTYLNHRGLPLRSGSDGGARETPETAPR